MVVCIMWDSIFSCIRCFAKLVESLLELCPAVALPHDSANKYYTYTCTHKCSCSLNWTLMSLSVIYVRWYMNNHM